MLTVGGDCAVDVEPIAAAKGRHGRALTVLWIDAHPDVYGPGDLVSGAFHGMVVRTLLGDGPADLTPAHTLTPDQVVLAGVRTGGRAEWEYLQRTGLKPYDVDHFQAALTKLTGPVYVHVDLDVLDPNEFASVCYGVPQGVFARQIIELVQRIDHVVGAAITEHAPKRSDPREDEVIVALVRQHPIAS